MSNKTLTFFKFDDFYLDAGERFLTFQDQPVALTPKAFQTLVLLLRNHGRVVEKEYFLNEVWADTFVEESTLAQNILTLRKTLSRFNNDKEFIATIPRRGYQFVGVVQEISGKVLTDETIIECAELFAEDKFVAENTFNDAFINKFVCHIFSQQFFGISNLFLWLHNVFLTRDASQI